MEKKIKIIYVISGVNYSLGFLWLSQFVNKERYDVRFIFLNKTLPSIYDELKNAGIKYTMIDNAFDSVEDVEKAQELSSTILIES